ncbi:MULTISPECIES: hypothetical protein [Acinetobacter]|uniref:hypothetical protein n=1 Tax=Acinetobacter TaxID=469 RepID=UPI0002CED084|nr:MULTISPECIES: hypothetical protein [Acinetobacter]ENV01898.1 hypothetical protein F968_03072 [Acinetobacter sp. NIPH 817]MCU4637745.1 hypothetical protein [Acinetobacter sp. WU_MDCI_Abxa265]RFF23249.1 hypothetical protein DZ985_16035 [Acinetobacter sp. JW]
MNDIFLNFLIGSTTGKIYIPTGIGPFPTIIIFDTGLMKSTKTYANFYAKRMKEIGFSVFIVKLNKKDEIGTIIEFILSHNEVNINKLYLIKIEKNKLIDSNIELYKDYFQAIASINCFSLNS